MHPTLFSPRGQFRPVRRPVQFRPGSSTAGPELLERRAVPAVTYGPIQFNTPPFPVTNPDVSATLSETGNQVTATYTLTAAGLAAAQEGQTFPVGLAVYSITSESEPLGQVRVLNVQGAPLSACNSTERITICLPHSGSTEGEQGETCDQVDAYWGCADNAPLILSFGPPNDTLNAHLLAGLQDCSDSPTPCQYAGQSADYYRCNTGAFTALGINPKTTTLADLFGSSTFTGPYASLAKVSLLQALNLQGGSGLLKQAELLLKQAVAGYLNASFGNYPLSAAQVVQDVQNALASQNATTIGNLQTQLASYNSLGRSNWDCGCTTGGDHGDDSGDKGGDSGDKGGDSGDKGGNCGNNGGDSSDNGGDCSNRQHDD